MDSAEGRFDNSGEKDAILKRLKRVEGQIKGIQKMIEGDKCCVDVLTQVAAARAAINKVGGMVLENYSKTCLKNAILNDDREKAVTEMVDTIQKFLKFLD